MSRSKLLYKLLWRSCTFFKTRLIEALIFSGLVPMRLWNSFTTHPKTCLKRFVSPNFSMIDPIPLRAWRSVSSLGIPFKNSHSYIWRNSFSNGISCSLRVKKILRFVSIFVTSSMLFSYSVRMTKKSWRIAKFSSLDSGHWQIRNWAIVTADEWTTSEFLLRTHPGMETIFSTISQSFFNSEGVAPGRV